MVPVSTLEINYTCFIHKIQYTIIHYYSTMQLPQLSSLPLLEQQMPAKEPSTQSQNSSDSGFRKAVKQLTPITKKQMEDINTKIKMEISSNKKRYEKLLALNPYFSMKLYSPLNSFTSDEYHSGTLKKLMKQIDMLLDQGSLIEKEIKKSELKRMHGDYLDPTERNEIKNHYTYLRKIWLDFNKIQPKNMTDKLEELNKRVVIIKNNIFTVTEHQKRCYDHQQHYEQVDSKVKEMVYKTEEYNRLKERFETLNMALEESSNRYHEICERYELKLNEKDQDISRLVKDVDNHKTIVKELKEKIVSIERKQLKYIERITELENDIKLKTKLYSNMKENNESQNNLRFLKEDSYINQIKFRKLDFDMHVRKSHFDVRENKETMIEKATHDQVQATPVKELHILPQVKDSKDVEYPKEDLCENSIEEFNERSFIRQNKSIEARKGAAGRFTRMRSPANGRLIKPRQDEQSRRDVEYCSPRIKEFREDDIQTLAGVSSCQV